MNFLTLYFPVFLTVAVLCYYICPKKFQNIVLLTANYVFYLWGNPALGLFLVLGTLVGYWCARRMEAGPRKRLWLAVCMLYCFGMLFVFKYLDFVCQSFLRLTGHGGIFSLDLALPIGISFYSFSLVGYGFDVYRGAMPAEKNLLRFAAFVSFFPSVLSGPINRARDLLPQLSAGREFEWEGFKGGLWRFLCGAAKKLVVASTLAGIIDPVYAAPAAYGGGVWLMTAILYSLYIYIDFSAYSDMAIGTAQMLNLRLTENFRAPYLSRTIQEFWKKWHISLTSWFREYLYFPLGGNRRGPWRTRLNVLIVFAVSGLWHGAGLTFLFWGLLNGLYQIAGGLTLPARRQLRKRLGIRENAWYAAAFQILFTFALATAAWVFFRAESLEQALFIVKRILLILRDGFGPVQGWIPERTLWVLVPGLALCFAGDLLIARGKSLRIERTAFLFWICAAALMAATLLFGQYGPGFQAQDFVYFKF